MAKAAVRPGWFGTVPNDGGNDAEDAYSKIRVFDFNLWSKRPPLKRLLLVINLDTLSVLNAKHSWTFPTDFDTTIILDKHVATIIRQSLPVIQHRHLAGISGGSTAVTLKNDSFQLPTGSQDLFQDSVAAHTRADTGDEKPTDTN